MILRDFLGYIYIYLDLPRGAEWMIKGAYTPSLRVQTAPPYRRNTLIQIQLSTVPESPRHLETPISWLKGKIQYIPEIPSNQF